MHVLMAGEAGALVVAVAVALVAQAAREIAHVATTAPAAVASRPVLGRVARWFMASVLYCRGTGRYGS